MSNRDKIIKTAAELFRFYGYDGTSIDMLIKEAGVSKSNFYYYFESKEELGLKILESLLRHQEDLISKILLNRDVDPLERFINFYIEATYTKQDLFQQSGSFFVKMALEQGSINERFRSIIEEFFQKTEVGVRICLEDCVKSGVIHKEVDMEQLPKFLISLFKGAMVMAKIHNSYAPIENAYNGILTLFLQEKWQHMALRHEDLPLPTLSYDEQMESHFFAKDL